MKNKVVMTKKSFVDEHKELVKALRSDKKSAIKKELKEQSEELDKKLRNNK